MPFFLNLLVASALGFLSGLGIGGGSLLIIWLMLVCKADYPAAKYINLMFFIPSALIATVIRLVQKKLPFRQVILAAISGCAAAAFLPHSAVPGTPTCSESFLARSFYAPLFGS